MNLRELFRSDPSFLGLAKFVTLFFVLTSVVSMIFFPNYSVSEDYISTLGTNRNPVHEFFNISLILTSILLLPTYFVIHYTLLRNVEERHVRLVKMSFGIALTSSTSLALVGVFPAEGNTLLSHNLAALVFFVSISFYYVILTWLLITIVHVCYSQFPFNRRVDYLGFAFVFLVAVLLDVSTWYNKLLQKFIVYSALLFLIYFSERLRLIDKHHVPHV